MLDHRSFSQDGSDILDRLKTRGVDEDQIALLTTLVAVEVLRSHFPGLIDVDLYDCFNLADGAVDALSSLIAQRGGGLGFN